MQLRICSRNPSNSTWRTESRLNPGFKLFTLTNPLAYYFILSQDKIIKVLIKITYSKYKKCLNTTKTILKVINGSGLTLIRSFINSSRLSSISFEANLLAACYSLLNRSTVCFRRCHRRDSLAMSSISIAFRPALPVSSSLFFFGRPILFPPEIATYHVPGAFFWSAATAWLNNNDLLCI